MHAPWNLLTVHAELQLLIWSAVIEDCLAQPLPHPYESRDPDTAPNRLDSYLNLLLTNKQIHDEVEHLLHQNFAGRMILDFHYGGASELLNTYNNCPDRIWEQVHFRLRFPAKASQFLIADDMEEERWFTRDLIESQAMFPTRRLGMHLFETGCTEDGLVMMDYATGWEIEWDSRLFKGWNGKMREAGFVRTSSTQHYRTFRVFFSENLDIEEGNSDFSEKSGSLSAVACWWKKSILQEGGSDRITTILQDYGTPDYEALTRIVQDPDLDDAGLSKLLNDNDLDNDSYRRLGRDNCYTDER